MLRDQLIQNPMAIFMGCLAWIPLSIWIVSFIFWMIGGEIDGLTGFLGIVGSVALGAVVMKPPTASLVPVGFFGILAITVMFPFVRMALNKRELRSVDIEAVERAYEVLRVRENNAGSRMRIARHLHNLGQRGLAIAVMESALQDVPVQFFRDEFMLLRMWQSTPVERVSTVSCPICGVPNDPRRSVVCIRCKGPYLLDRLRGRVVSNSVGRQLLGTWLILVALAVGISTIPSVNPPFNVLVALTSLGTISFGIALIIRGNSTQK